MLYAKVDENDNVFEVIDRPKWFYDDGSIVDDAYLANEGIYPIDTTHPEGVSLLESDLSVNPKESFVVDRVNGIVTNYYNIVAKTVDKVYTECCDRVDDLRNTKKRTDIPYTFPDGDGVVQIRNDADVNNIMALGMEALKDIIDGNPTKQHIFLDASNILRTMTAAQMADMASYIKGVHQQIYNSSWTHKHTNLKNIYDNTSLTDTQKIDQLIEYDIYIGW